MQRGNNNSLRTMGILSALLLIAIILPEFTDPYYDDLLVICVIYIIIAISFNLYMGFLGGLTLAHSAFFGLGGYITGLITVKWEWPTGVGLLVDVAVCAVVAFILGFAALRLKGAYFVMITVAFLGIVSGLVTAFYKITGSTSGLRGIPEVSTGFISFDSTQKFYYLALGTLVIISICMYFIINSRVGRGFIAVRDNEDMANALGINPFKYKMIGFILSGVIAGVAGWLYAHHIRIMDPTIFHYGLMFDIAFMVILGGAGTLVGPIVGGVVIVFGPDLFNEHIYDVDEAWRTASMAMFMLVLILLVPQGIWGYVKMKWMMHQAHKGMPTPPDGGSGRVTAPLLRAIEPLKSFLNRGSEPN
jgi:branched-chain amino acid transport system permease protein